MEKNIYELIKILQQIAESITERETILPHQKEDVVELLTIKECLKLITGLRESSLRKWIKQGKIAYKRAGETENGKILVVKSSLLEFFKEANNS